MRLDEQAFYEAEHALCATCGGSGVDPSAAGVPLCPDCDGFGELELEG